MKLKRIVQFAAGFNEGDAISNEMLFLKKNFEELGFKSEIYAENIGSNKKKSVKKYRSYKNESSDLIIYHHSIHSSVLEIIEKLKNKKIMIYHNVTPFEFFIPYDLKLSHFLKKGREELFDLKNSFDYNFADSKFNLNELNEIGFENTNLLPIHYDFSKLKITNTNKSEIKNIIFVGRIAPNKKQEDLIKIAKILKENFDLKFKLHIVGYCSKELNLFKSDLDSYIKIFQLEEHVFFSDFVDDEKLCEYYSNADLFLCMSEHEGFCVPLLESMHYKIPIIAYSAGAIEDTLNGAGIVFKEKDFLRIAEMINYIFENNSFRENVIENQNKKLEEFKRNDSLNKLNQIIENYR